MPIILNGKTVYTESEAGRYSRLMKDKYRCKCGHVHAVKVSVETWAGHTPFYTIEPSTVCYGPCGLHKYKEDPHAK